MKKLLVLMLVLGMASLASAVPVVTGIVSWEVVGGQLIGTGIDLGDADLYLATAAYGGSNTVLSRDDTTNGSPGANLAAGNNGKILLASSIYWRAIAGDIAEVTQETGEWFRMNIDTTEATDIYVHDGAANWAELGMITVPEPMTMVLLGIGGLFLRRRK